MTVNKPPALRHGGRVAITAPSGCVDERALDEGVAALRREGFAVELGRNVLARKGYLAGDEKARARELIGFFGRKDIDAIFCARGGFGSMQLLPELAKETELAPKLFVGYSDVTVLLNWFLRRFAMVTFHGPMVAADFARGLSEHSKAHFLGMLKGEVSGWSVPVGAAIRPGQAAAAMVGGCLSLLAATLGTPYEVETAGRILLIEDIDEKPYRIERMLTHLKLAGKLDNLAGLVCGDFIRCEGDGSREVVDIIKELFADAAFPVVTGFPAGHGDENLALPFGVRMRLDATRGTLSLLESPVI
jgi:muramoyltetrapeptide carboxypeptidase